MFPSCLASTLIPESTFQVSVLPVLDIKVLQHSHNFVTNVPKKKGVSIPFVLLGDKSKDRHNNLHGTLSFLENH